ncbi:Uncharacterised protein [Bordetella pertussis]|nr:Uncharacterised protein [Bordetella pertussis]
MNSTENESAARAGNCPEPSSWKNARAVCHAPGNSRSLSV